MRNIIKGLCASLFVAVLMVSMSFVIPKANAVATKALVEQLAGANGGGNNGFITVRYYQDNGSILSESTINFSLSGVDSSKDFQDAAIAAVITDAANNSITITSDDIVWPPVAEPTQSTATHTFTTSTGSTGFQVSALHDSEVRYNVTIATTATIAGGADGTVVLEMASTNSSTAGDWKEIGRFRNGQVLSLAVTLQSVQTTAGQLTAFVPAGYYVKLRTINNSGTPIYTYNSGQEVVE